MFKKLFAAPATPQPVPMRPGLPLVMLAMLAVGITACGSSTPSGAQASTATPAKKEAGLGSDIQLTVINESGKPLPFSLCDASMCRNSDLQNGEESTVIADTPQGHFQYPDGSRVYFGVYNPILNPPKFHLDPNKIIEKNFSQVNTGLVEGEVQQVSVAAGPGTHPFQLERRGDTQYKIMRLIAK